MSDLSLKDMARLFETTNPLEAGNNPDMNSFLIDVMNSGEEILSSLSEDEFAAAVSMVQSVMAAEVLTSGDVTTFMNIMHNDVFIRAVIKAMQITIGFATREEWR